MMGRKGKVYRLVAVVRDDCTDCFFQPYGKCPHNCGILTCMAHGEGEEYSFVLEEVKPME